MVIDYLGPSLFKDLFQLRAGDIAIIKNSPGIKVFFFSGGEIVNDTDLVAQGYIPVDNMRADKAGPTGNK